MTIADRTPCTNEILSFKRNNSSIHIALEQKMSKCKEYSQQCYQKQKEVYSQKRQLYQGWHYIITSINKITRFWHTTTTCFSNNTPAMSVRN